MTGLFQDLRYAVRQLRKSPAFTAVALFTLALGIGMSTAIFTVVDAVLLRPLAFSEAGKLMTVWEKPPGELESNVGYQTFMDWQSQSESFERLAVSSEWQPILGSEQGGERLYGRRVSSDFFRVLRTQPLYGRDFISEENRRGGDNHVVIISHSLWKNRFGGDAGLVGKSIAMNGVTYKVVGVLPSNFDPVFVSDGKAVEVFGPLAYDTSLPWACRTCRHLQAIGRLKSGVTEQNAMAEMNTLSQRLFRDHPTEYSGPGVSLIPLQEHVVCKSRVALYTLLISVLAVLLIACGNVTSLLLSRATERSREIAVRSALGAGRLRLIRQMLTEGLLLSLVSGVLGVMLGSAALRLLPLFGSAALPRTEGISLDVRVLSFSLALSLLASLFCALAPALHSTRLASEDGLKEETRTSAGTTRQRLRSILVTSNVAFALVLLLSVGLLLRSFGHLLSVDAGFDPHKVLTAQIDVVGPQYKDEIAILQFFENALHKVRALPGVEDAAVISQLPLGGNLDAYGIHVEGKVSPNPENDPSGDRYSISPSYLHVMGIPVLRGRSFTVQDRKDSLPVVLVNESLARSKWPGEDPIGKRLKVGGLDGPWKTVVGVVGDVLHSGLDAPHSLQFYVPESQWPGDNSMVMVMRTSVGPQTLIADAKHAVASVSSNAAFSKPVDMEQVMSASLAPRRFTMWLLGVFALVALTLATVGIYGIVSYFVSSRRREIGVRMALGAAPKDVVQMVLRRGLALASSGVAIGLALGLMAGRVLASMLFRVHPTDIVTFSCVSVLLVVAAMLASYLPARRAAKVDPMVALRYE